jgi:hypothetical protein
MDTNTKKILFIFGGGYILYLAFKKVFPVGGSNKKGANSKGSKVQSEKDKKNAIIVMKAYSDAQNAGETKAFLDEMNAEFAKQYGLKVYTEKSSGNIFASDLQGNKIL